MKNSLAVLNSNARTKDGYILPLQVLEGGLWQTSPYGIPSNLGHDFHRPIGWMNPFGLYLEPGIARTVGTLRIAETSEDQKQINTGRKNAVVNRMHEEMSKYGDKFMPLIEKHTTPEAKFIDISSLACIDEAIVDRVFPFMNALKVKDDLIPVNDLLKHFKYLGQGVFGHNASDLIIYAHSFFRRSLSRYNNFHFIFLDELMSHASNPATPVKIAIDWDAVGLKQSFHTSFEFEYWWGPKYDDNIQHIEVGLATHKSSDMEKAYYGVSSTEFFWKTDDNLHEFELEELREDPAPTLAEDSYGCRYVHSIFDKNKDTFCHFDGAIRMYAGELMLERIGKKMTEFGRRSKYTKIFRIDGKLPVKDWKSLVTNYMQGNPLVYEYFGLEKPNASKILSQENETLKERYVPFSLSKSEGMRIMVSYYKHNPRTEVRIVTNTDQLSVSTEVRAFIEYDLIEYLKSFKRLGLELVIPDNVIYGFAEDLYWNIPCIFHGNIDPQADVTASLRAFTEIINALEKHKIEKVISLTLSWNNSGKEIRVSMLGHSSDWNQWLKTFDTIPTNRDELVKWISIQYAYLSRFEAADDKPSIFELSQFDGTLYLKRRNVEPEFRAVYRHVGEQIICSLELPKSRTDIISALKQRIITPVVSFICLGARCNVCGGEYWDCSHSIILDGNVTIEPHIRRFGAFWTDKPSQDVHY